MNKNLFHPFAFFLFGVLIILLLEFLPQLFYSTNFNIQAFNNVLHAKEEIASNTLNQLTTNKKSLPFKKTADFEKLAQEGLYFFIEKNNKITFWSSNTVPLGSFKDFNSSVGMIHLKNGWYQYLLKEENRTKYLALILIKNHYTIDNDYLSSNFHKSFHLHNDVEITFKETKDAYSINSLSGQFLFALKEQQFSFKSSNWLTVLLFLIAYIFLISSSFLLFNKISSTKKWSGIITILFLIGFYGASTYFGFPSSLYQQKIFSPNIYAHSLILPSLGNFLMMSVAVFSFSILLIKQAKTIDKTKKLNAIFYVIISSLISIVISNWFIGLIKNSKINFDVNYLLDLSAYSFIGIFIVITLFISMVVLIKTSINSFTNQAFRFSQLLPIYWCFGLITVIIAYFLYHTDWILSSWFLLVILVFSFSRASNFFQGATLLIVLALSISYGFIHYSSQKNELNNVSLLKKLAKEKDPITEYLYQDLQPKIESDTFLLNHVNTYWGNKAEVDKYILNKYFSGYWSRYDVNTFLCQPKDTLFIESENVEKSCIDFFNEKIEKEKVNPFDDNLNINFLYTDDGISSYVATASLKHKDSLHHNSYLFVELTPKILANTEGYPELLLNKKEMDVSINLNKYSFAKYKKNKLTTHLGSYNYNTVLSSTLKFNEDGFAQINVDGFEHLFYQSNKTTVVVLSSTEKPFFNYITTFCYFFLVVGISALIIGLIFRVSPFNWKIATTNFSTKIQLFVIVSTFISFILFGWGTSYYIKKQYAEKNTKAIQEKVQSVLAELSSALGNETSITKSLKGYIDYQLIKFSNVFYSDINLYDTTGNLISSSRPEIIERGLISDKMNPTAFLTLNQEKRSAFIHDENISSLNYLSAYVPFRNNKNKVIAYLNLPYFAKQNELERELSSFYTSLINSYALLFLISVIIAILFANYISEPVRLIKEKIRALQLGKTNELIEWQTNDEIGSLVREYNQKVLELEQSAELLAKSERESAWREMAKQVAHEIKNPLTPMKLSIQHLERSITDNPDDINERVKRTAKTLIDQIDTLTNIANEFSNFAKMPKAKQQEINLIPILETCIDLLKDKGVLLTFKNNCTSEVKVIADKDQMNRVFTNLITNAIQSIPENIDGLIEVICNRYEDSVIIEIRDNGSGIAEELQEKIFQPNFTTKTNGMGLGLAMVKNIIENAGGTISFTTKENEGTTFKISLPSIE